MQEYQKMEKRLSDFKSDKKNVESPELMLSKRYVLDTRHGVDFGTELGLRPYESARMDFNSEAPADKQLARQPD